MRIRLGSSALQMLQLGRVEKKRTKELELQKEAHTGSRGTGRAVYTGALWIGMRAPKIRRGSRCRGGLEGGGVLATDINADIALWSAGMDPWLSGLQGAQSAGSSDPYCRNDAARIITQPRAMGWGDKKAMLEVEWPLWRWVWERVWPCGWSTVRCSGLAWRTVLAGWEGPTASSN